MAGILQPTSKPEAFHVNISRRCGLSVMIKDPLVPPQTSDLCLPFFRYIIIQGLADKLSRNLEIFHTIPTERRILAGRRDDELQTGRDWKHVCALLF